MMTNVGFRMVDCVEGLTREGFNRGIEEIPIKWGWARVSWLRSRDQGVAERSEGSDVPPRAEESGGGVRTRWTRGVSKGVCGVRPTRRSMRLPTDYVLRVPKVSRGGGTLSVVCGSFSGAHGEGDPRH